MSRAQTRWLWIPLLLSTNHLKKSRVQDYLQKETAEAAQRARGDYDEAMKEAQMIKSQGRDAEIFSRAYPPAHSIWARLCASDASAIATTLLARD